MKSIYKVVSLNTKDPEKFQAQLNENAVDGFQLKEITERFCVFEKFSE